MDNEHDTPLILTEEYSNKVANGIADGILAYLNVEKNTATEEVKQEIVEAVVDTHSKIDVKYQAFSGKKWLPDVKNCEDFAGVLGQAISGFRGNTVRKRGRRRKANILCRAFKWSLARRNNR